MSTRATEIELAVAMAVRTDGTITPTSALSDADGQPAIERSATLHTGDTLTLDKFVGIVASFDADDPAQSALAAARNAAANGYSGLQAANNAEWSKTWQAMDVVVEGDIEAQHALRFNIFQLIITAPRFTDRASIGAKTLSGFEMCIRDSCSPRKQS